MRNRSLTAKPRRLRAGAASGQPHDRSYREQNATPSAARAGKNARGSSVRFGAPEPGPSTKKSEPSQPPGRLVGPLRTCSRDAR